MHAYKRLNGCKIFLSQLGLHTNLYMEGKLELETKLLDNYVQYRIVRIHRNVANKHS